MTPSTPLRVGMVQRGRLGTVRHVRAQYLQDWLSDENGPLTWRLDKSRSGSGALGDIGAHSIDAAQWITGQRITGVSALLHTFVSQRPLSGELVGLGGQGKQDAGTPRGKVTVGSLACDYEDNNVQLDNRRRNTRMTGKKSALVVRGGWDGHQPVEATELFIPFLQDNGYDVRIEEAPKIYADTEYLAGVDLIMQCMTMSTIERDELQGLRTAVENGTGLAGWHGGIADSYRNTSDYLHLIGGQFACHPGKHPDERQGGPEDNYVPYTVNMLTAASKHPITRGIGDFDLVTEQYWMLADDYIDVLATTTQKVRAWDPWHREVTSPAIWTRKWGAGKIFVCTPGHRVEILQDSNVRTIIERGLLWASR